MKAFQKGLAVFFILMALSNLIVWILLITSGQVSDIELQLPSFLHHWLSELMMDVFAFIAAVMLLRKMSKAWNWSFAALGMSACATLNAAGYYAYVEPDTGFFAMLGGLFLLSMTAAILSARILGKRQDRGSSRLYWRIFLLGVAVYFMLNIAADMVQKGFWFQYVISLSILAAGFTFLARLLRAEFFIRE